MFTVLCIPRWSPIKVLKRTGVFKVIWPMIVLLYVLILTLWAPDHIRNTTYWLLFSRHVFQCHGVLLPHHLTICQGQQVQLSMGRCRLFPLGSETTSPPSVILFKVSAERPCWSHRQSLCPHAYSKTSRIRTKEETQVGSVVQSIYWNQHLNL